MQTCDESQSHELSVNTQAVLIGKLKAAFIYWLWVGGSWLLERVCQPFLHVDKK